MPNMQRLRRDKTLYKGATRQFILDQTVRVSYRGYSPAEIKKHATGKGNAGKPMMLAAAVRKWPDWSGDDNEADARWLVDLAMKKYESEAT